MIRVYHPWWKWECYKAGFYNTTPLKGFSPDDMKIKYSEFLSNFDLFESALSRVISEWKYSCEHFLTNASMNKIAWLGQASACISIKLPSVYRGGYRLMSLENQIKADNLAERYHRKWKEKYMNTSRNGSQEDIQMTFRM